MDKTKVIILSVVVLLLLLGVFTYLKSKISKQNSGTDQQTENMTMEPTQTELQLILAKFPDAIATKSGLHYIVLAPGGEEKPKEGDTVVVHYTGKLMDDSVFDSSIPRGEPFSFTLMGRQVIRGWDIGLSDMTKGEKRLLIIPAELGYGDRGSPPVIPPKATLVFEVELIDIK